MKVVWSQKVNEKEKGGETSREVPSAKKKTNGKDIRIWAEMRVDILFAPVMQDIDAKEHKTTVSPDGMKSSGKKMAGGEDGYAQKRQKIEKNRKTKRKEKLLAVSENRTFNLSGCFRPYLYRSQGKYHHGSGCPRQRSVGHC